MDSPLRRADADVVDAGLAAAHQAVGGELPHFVAAPPLAGQVAAFVLEPHRDSAVAERPQFLAERWLTAVHVDQDQPDPSLRDLGRFRALRDALRRLAAQLTDDTRSAVASAVDVDQAVAAVNSAAAQAPTWPELTYRNGELSRRIAGHANPIHRMLSAIPQQSVELLTGEERIRLRACYAPGCVLYFVKHHPRREWCSVGCGNRARAARHYHRHRGRPTEPVNEPESQQDADHTEA